MAGNSSQILEGVFAVKKPPNLSSAQVLRELQHKFAQSRTFAPLLQETRRKEAEQDRHQKKRRRKTTDSNVFKMGHGGTLDPLATGVLIVGIGRGTKSLNDFLGCTKTYETVVLFGKGTDSYDVAGKIVTEASHDHITSDLVEENLAAFRGKIKQVPPIYSALKINGMKAYEYARTGQELPRELENRDMTVDECTLLKWEDGGSHDFRWPAIEAPEEEKAVARKFLKGADVTTASGSHVVSNEEKHTPAKATPPPIEKRPTKKEMNSMSAADKAALHTHEQTLSDTPADGPAATIRLTVSSGFYVRSFAHDLGLACRSFGTMAGLLRSRQGDYVCTDPVPEGLVPCLTYEELDGGEDVWGPKLSKVLQDWLIKNPVRYDGARVDDRDRPGNSKNWRGFSGRGHPRSGRNEDQKSPRKRKYDGDEDSRVRRNSSSPE